MAIIYPFSKNREISVLSVYYSWVIRGIKPRLVTRTRDFLFDIDALRQAIGSMNVTAHARQTSITSFFSAFD